MNTPEFINMAAHEGRQTPTNIGGDASIIWDDGL